MRKMKGDMQRLNPASEKAINSLSRRGFLFMSLLSSSGLGLALSGCSLASLNPDDLNGRAAIINDWLDAANKMEISKFQSLHTESVTYYPFQVRNPKKGIEDLWSAFQSSASGHLEDAFIFGNEDTVCVQTKSRESARSHCYVLGFQDNLIDIVYEYAARYSISSDSLKEKRSPVEDSDALIVQMNTVDSLTDALNDRDYEGFLNAYSEDALLNGFLSITPLTGFTAIRNAAQRFFEAYPNAKFNHYQAFNQGNLVCQQVTVERGPVRSLALVHILENGKISYSVEYFSHAKLNQE